MVAPLETLQQLLAGGDPGQAELQDLRRRLDWLEAGRFMSLDEAFQYTPAHRRKRRDDALRHAADLIDPCHTLSHWERAKRLAKAIRRVSRLAESSPRGEIDKLIEQAQAAHRCPASARHLMRIVE